ncbi:glycine-rich domain-containing protein 1 [Selaginella moellendorffii]|uniref:glycine-rich domain-containing protein 1 n=1 Tax=Selaginella moellendorffii TaxID=88036 RepID=UPI000D1C98CB|nr:glycine-rich domain-containing protein 1 [Selaginella moellendorffii]|eukprot:XP_024522650.1 glycine-rich domain-containing protein 1 [Selaginella moellendorffii]
MMAESEAQRSAWESAQRLKISVDLVDAAKEELEFLALVDRIPRLYEGEALNQAIHRYTSFWLPFAAAYDQNDGAKLPLVPPLDCAWVWHCHRLSPVRYAQDCKALFGKIVDAPLASPQSKDAATIETQKLWSARFPDEPFNLDVNYKSSHSSSIPEEEGRKKLAQYLEGAVSRQKSFYYQVSQAHYLEESFLKAAEQRYKGFLYLMTLGSTFFVPTYDVDVMWHAHQRSPAAYHQDLIRILGTVLDHDDTDSDRTKGRKLDNGFTKTRDIWEKTYGFPYEKAGCMYRGDQPSVLPKPTGSVNRPLPSLDQAFLTARKTLQVRLAVLSARNVPAEKSSSTFVSLSTFANFLTQTPEVATASPNPQWDKLWQLECDAAAGGLVLELRQRRKGFLGLSKGSKLLGALTITWKMILETSTLSLHGWFPLFTPDGVTTDKVPSLRVEVSVTPPVRAPYVMKVTKPELRGEKHLAKVLDHTNKDVFHAHTSFSSGVRSITVAATHNAGHKLVLLAVAETPNLWQWSLDGDCTIVIGRNAEYEVHFGACGDGCPVTLLAGRKLQFALAGTKDVNEGFVTLTRYLPEAPNGKATALFNWKTGYMEVTVEENTMLVAALLCATATSMACLSLGNQKPVTKSLTSRSYRESRGFGLFGRHQRSKLSACDIFLPEAVILASAGCGGGCNGNCGGKTGSGSPHHPKGGACGSGCGGAGGCGSSLPKAGAHDSKGGACGSGCGGGGGCGGGCGSSLPKDDSKGGACGSGCGGGGGCGGGCGSSLPKDDSKGGACGSGCGGGGGCGGGCGSSLSNAGAHDSKGGACGSGCGGGCGSSVFKAQDHNIVGSSIPNGS